MTGQKLGFPDSGTCDWPVEIIKTIKPIQRVLENSCQSFKKSDNIWEKNIHREKFDPYGNILALWNSHLVSHYRNWYMHSKPKITFPRLNDGWPIGHAILLITLDSLVIYMLVTLLMTFVFYRWIVIQLHDVNKYMSKHCHIKPLRYHTIPSQTMRVRQPALE